MLVHAGKTLFTEDELRCKGSGLLILAPGFDLELLKLRVAFDMPMSVNSCCRSESHNRAVGGHPRSLHVCDKPYWPTGGCCSIDVGTRHRGEGYRQKLIKLAESLNWSVGIHPHFIHLDRRVDYTSRPRATFPY
ncbi:D-Ala-D-Ala carboxypeptidase family metallohydrolase [Ectothiorhodospira shaposhnikovii]|uniref:D-Ala-D-Ala carboxypeptidase family metallohydrolase n=1 Tax=Ectothiorhodospira shaposhnikovii TaxID=1054 RepID=UPI003B834FCD